ncbi:MAG TPA: hypothetical protein DE045_09590 [Oceanospirillaceae bacterium]|nr:hypothetical protein [Oceanospirillaceae bacterium]
MIYSVAVELGTSDNDYGVVVPDIKGCFSSGSSFEEALKNAKDAISFHLEGLAEHGQLPPVPKGVDEHMSNHEFDGWVWGMIEIDVRPYLGNSSKINVTLPDLVTKQIDDIVKTTEQFKSRSHFLQQAAKAQILECA